VKKLLLTLSAAILLLIFFFPQIVSSSFGNRIFLQAIQSRTHTQVSANKLNLSWLGPQTFSDLAFESEQLKGTLQELRIGVRLWSLLPLFELKNFNSITGDVKVVNGAFQFTSDTLPSVQLDSIQGVVRIHDGGADFTTEGQASQNNQPGTFSLQGQVGHFNQSIPEFSIHGEWTSFPTLPLARIFSARQPIDEISIVQLLGSSIDLQGNATYSNEEGLFDLILHAPNIDSTIHGSIANQNLTLRQPLTATIRLTPEFSRWILRDVNPLFVTGIEAKSPIRLRIEPSRFRCPLATFHLEHLEIGQGTLEIGQLRCSNGGSLATLISLLKNKTLFAAREMDLWFTPLYFSLQEGVLQTSRVDFLIDQTIHLCTWGNIDYLHDRLDMFVGLPAETLQQSFGIEKIPADYVMKIPLTGTMKKPKLATHGAAAKIAALLTAQNSPHSWLSSGILGIFGEIDTSVPPPKRPFPWESEQIQK
jgi:hypothetical protein